MLKAVARICQERGVACQVSLEAPMACGLGACLGCAIPAAAGGYLRACQEGPVLDAGRVDWERV
jgi:dihydroorotate dehydrogenase electron transfer subunit